MQRFLTGLKGLQGREIDDNSWRAGSSGGGPADGLLSGISSVDRIRRISDWISSSISRALVGCCGLLIGCILSVLKISLPDAGKAVGGADEDAIVGVHD